MLKQHYINFCASALDLPVFMEPWYLDAVCRDGGWDVVLVEKASKVVAALPFYYKQKWGMRYVAMPVLGRFMGPYIHPDFRSLSKANALMEELIAQLPQLASFEQDFNYQVSNWLPFYWQGFRQTTRYSYFLDLQASEEHLWKNLASDYRNQKIPRAREILHVYQDDNLESFLRIHDLSYRRQGMQPPVSLEFLRGLDAALAAHQRRAIFFAADSEQNIHAVAYLIWDQQRAWYLMAGDDPALRQSGASVLINWEAIQYAKQVLQVPVFDFAGSMVQPIERVRRQFGAQQQAYFRVWKDWNWMMKLGRLRKG